MRRYYLHENNSGGRFWLSDKNYKSLFADGWKLDQEKVDRRDEYGGGLGDEKGVPYSWRDAAYIEARDLRDAVESFEAATGQDFFAEGCNCCGSPFSIGTDSSDKGEWEYLSGDDVSRIPIRPW